MENGGNQRRDEPLQLIDFERQSETGMTTIKLQSESLDRIFTQIGDRKVCILCVCGPSRQGKSFLLGYMIRCLECLEKEEDDWMDWANKSKPLEGFVFRNGSKPETQGIWLWSRPFLIKTDDGEEVAVLLMDTQGTNDEFTTNKDMSAIVGLSLLTSSVMIFNFFTNLQEDILMALNTYIQYGSLALEKAEGSGTPFQKLCFLIRDWNNPSEFPFGEKGGKKFMDEKLKVKENQPPEAKHVRETIRKCFEELDCFLLPQIGEKALYKDFKGSIEELSPKFAKDMEKFINGLISTETITVKKILGNPVAPSELKSFLETYIEIFNSEEVPSADSMWQATSQMSNNNVLEKALKKYRECLKKKLRGNIYLQEEDLDRAHNTGEKQAMDLFKKAKTFGSPETILEYEEKLEKALKTEFSNAKKSNAEKRTKIVTQAHGDAVDACRSQVEEEVPFDEDNETEFYEESKINSVIAQAQSVALAEFKEKFSNEPEDRLLALVSTLEGTLETACSRITTQNKIQRGNAEKKMEEIVEELLTNHSNKLTEYLDKNKFEEDETKIQGIHEAEKAAGVVRFNTEKKPGKKDFHKVYLTKLEAEMDNAFKNLYNAHKSNIQQIFIDMDDLLTEFCSKYLAELKAIAESDDGIDERDLWSTHSTRSQGVLERFQQENIPFPEGSPKRAAVVNKLQERLEQAHDTVKMEVVVKGQRSVDSYRKAVEHAFAFYKQEMKGILESDDFVSDEDDLVAEHDRIFQEAIDQYENYPKIGFPDEAIRIKAEMKYKLIEFFDAAKESNRRRKEMAHSKGKNLVSDCVREYNAAMKAEMSNARTVEEFTEQHEKAKREGLEKFERDCPVRDPAFLEEHLDIIKEELDETFDELKDVFELKRNEEETILKAVIIEATSLYHREMSTHCKNDFFMTPASLENQHDAVKSHVITTCENRTPLNDLQKIDLGNNLDDLLLPYKKKNDMHLNSGEFGTAPAIGIDLGTTYCCVAVFYKGKVHIIPNPDHGELTTPSYVAFDPDGSETIGSAAKDNAYKNPENTIYDAKRIIGRKITDPDLQNDMTYWPFTVQEDEGVPKVIVNGNPLHPEQISAKLLAYFRRMAEQHLKLPPGTITKAVITVPAYFNDGQRAATVDAGEMAGFDEVLTILNEPTAAALAYSLERLDSEAKKILIYDLGGGTFDVSVLEMKPKDIDVLGVKGDTHLGGEDFDKNMMSYCAEVFKTQFGVDLFDGKDSTDKNVRFDARRILRRLQTYCERAKRDLATARTTKVSVDAIKNGLDLIVDITREKFEELNDAYFRKSIDMVDQTLRDVMLTKDQIDDVVLVGGSSRIPKVQEMLSAYFNGKVLNKSIHPDHAVAHGAAVQAALMNGAQAKGQIDFTQIRDVTPMSLGIEVVTKELSVILQKNTKIPTRKKEVYYTVKDNQTSIHVKIYQGEDWDVAANNKLLGTFDLDGIPSKKAGVEPVDVWMEINSMGILHVEAICRSTKGKKSITVNENKQRMTKEQKSRCLEPQPA